MVTIHYRNNGRIVRRQGTETVVDEPFGDDDTILWVDLSSPTRRERSAVEKAFDVEFQSRQEAEEIESSSRYYEEEDIIWANSNFLIQQGDSFASEPVSFVLKRGVLFTQRNADFRSFGELSRRLNTSPRYYTDGYAVIVDIFESRIDLDADVIEGIARDITVIGKTLSVSEQTSQEMLLQIARFQETTMMLRENVIDKQRVVSSMIKSVLFPRESHDKLRILIKDINSVLEHTAFSFERLEYLQNTFMGLINIEQNKIIKIFTVVSVIFMPPTLIASVYGMNFRLMPELNWDFGYGFAIGLMVVSSALTLYIFKTRNWL